MQDTLHPTPGSGASIPLGTGPPALLLPSPPPSPRETSREIDMGLLSGSASLARYTITARPPEPDFDKVPFREIEPGSELRESSGFLPYEPGGEWQIGPRRWAFRVRVDTVRPDRTAMRELLARLVRGETEATGRPFVPAPRLKELRQEAEEELILRSSPRTHIVECVIEDRILWIGSAAKTRIGKILELLRRLGITAEAKTPWGDRGQGAAESDIVNLYEPGESVLGCRFLKALLGDPDILYEPEKGGVRLQTRHATVSLTGEVLPDLHRFVEKGCEILSAKLLMEGGTGLRLDGPSHRIQSLRFDGEPQAHWIEQLDERLGRIKEIVETLDTKYGQLAPKLGR